MISLVVIIVIAKIILYLIDVAVDNSIHIHRLTPWYSKQKWYNLTMLPER